MGVLEVEVSDTHYGMFWSMAAPNDPVAVKPSGPFAGPLGLFGSHISYYTGKLEAYLRYKEIPYRWLGAGLRLRRQVKQSTGAAQLPALQLPLPDGRWMTDTTPIIEWLEERIPEPAVIPHDPLLGFVSRLVEDYAEEWLWRPAMHFRWSYPADRVLLSRRIVAEMTGEIPLPAFVKRALIRRRQRHAYVQRDGVCRETWDHVEGIYLKMLAHLEAVFAKRSFLLGARPTLADFGYFASIFRHFSQDPTPAEIMRRRAPAVFAWQARLWNARASTTRGEILSGVPEDLDPIFSEIGSAYLPYLCANASAWKAGRRRHDARIQGVHYRDLPVSQYRVWCLERLRAHYQALPGGPQAEARALLEAHGCWQPLWQIDHPDSHYPASETPFRGRKVHYHNAKSRPKPGRS